MDKKRKMDEITKIKENLVGWLSMNSQCGSCIQDMEDVQVMGEVADMIKDLAQAAKECIETEYYETVIKAMEESGDEREEESRYGYNKNHYANGRFAPSGHGSRVGYSDDGMSYGGSHGHDGKESSYAYDGTDGRAGYTNWDMMPEEFDPRYGEAYNQYKKARRNYTNTNSEKDKKEMEQHAKKHEHDLIETMKDIYKHATPEMKQEFKSDLTKMVNDLTSM